MTSIVVVIIILIVTTIIVSIAIIMRMLCIHSYRSPNYQLQSVIHRIGPALGACCVGFRVSQCRIRQCSASRSVAGGLPEAGLGSGYRAEGVARLRVTSRELAAKQRWIPMKVMLKRPQIECECPAPARKACALQLLSARVDRPRVTIVMFYILQPSPKGQTSGCKPESAAESFLTFGHRLPLFTGPLWSIIQPPTLGPIRLRYFLRRPHPNAQSVLRTLSPGHSPRDEDRSH